MKKRFTDAQIIGFLKQASAGTPIKELCRKHDFAMHRFTCGAGNSAAWTCRMPSA
jgi:hypothetical protein